MAIAVIAELFVGRLSRGLRPTLGDAAMRGKAAIADADVKCSWVRLGDPLMRLK
jgi:hypothetical protein